MGLVSLEHLSSFVLPIEVAECAYPDISNFGGLKKGIRDGALDASRATSQSA